MDLKERVNPSRAALIVVDMQNDYCDPNGEAAIQGKDIEPARSILPRLTKIIDAARQVNTPVYFVKNAYSDLNDSEAWLNRRAGIGREGSRACRKGSWGAELWGVEPRENEAVLEKSRNSAFIGTNFDRILRAHGRESLLFTGIATNVCVESSLRDALMMDFHVVLIEDCAAAATPEEHQGTVTTVSRQFGFVITSDELLVLWGAANGGRSVTV